MVSKLEKYAMFAEAPPQFTPKLRIMTRAKPNNWIRRRIRMKTGNEDKEH